MLTLTPDKFAGLRAAAQPTGVFVAEIGRVHTGEGVSFMQNGKALEFARPSYSHF